MIHLSTGRVVFLSNANATDFFFLAAGAGGREDGAKAPREGDSRVTPPVMAFTPDGDQTSFVTLERDRNHAPTATVEAARPITLMVQLRLDPPARSESEEEREEWEEREERDGREGKEEMEGREGREEREGREGREER